MTGTCLWSIFLLLILFITDVKSDVACPKAQLQQKTKLLVNVLKGNNCRKSLFNNLLANRPLVNYIHTKLCPRKITSYKVTKFDTGTYLVTVQFTSNKAVYNGQLAFNQQYKLCGLQFGTLVPQAFPLKCVYKRPTLTPTNASLKLPSGFNAAVIATVPGARELVSLPNGDLIVGTQGTAVKIILNADGADLAGATGIFATFSETSPEGVAFGGGYIFASTEKTIWRMPYKNGQRAGTPVKIALVRQGPIAPNSDGDVHKSTSVSVSGQTLYAGIGSSCNACEEVDETRATIQMMKLDGTEMKLKAKRWRNPK
ncbi:unnamed protein product [Didymodactylos carnosus]|uniref:Uncharacterized protein n=1 Tax=Didymodactylos carnosus TaxID=1234261 RepID=A0A815AFQ5_9BILA|nr:unnamed protein product [Didymodactylos carnosus]CAF1257015.1 unnamed protein product [Didymodactylos carnosus]CAF4031152.1 unnamed protein product [Didymodactylos carnosus]CAF4051036.1 unnamed protein product [Didymodactylos carnosus]